MVGWWQYFQEARDSKLKIWVSRLQNECPDMFEHVTCLEGISEQHGIDPSVLRRLWPPGEQDYWPLAALSMPRPLFRVDPSDCPGLCNLAELWFSTLWGSLAELPFSLFRTFIKNLSLRMFKSSIRLAYRTKELCRFSSSLLPSALLQFAQISPSYVEIRQVFTVISFRC